MHLRGIQELDMRGFNQATITNAAFVHLRGIQKLNMFNCSQITDAALMHLRGSHTPPYRPLPSRSSPRALVVLTLVLRVDVSSFSIPITPHALQESEVSFINLFLEIQYFSFTT